ATGAISATVRQADVLPHGRLEEGLSRRHGKSVAARLESDDGVVRRFGAILVGARARLRVETRILSYGPAAQPSAASASAGIRPGRGRPRGARRARSGLP